MAACRVYFPCGHSRELEQVIYGAFGTNNISLPCKSQFTCPECGTVHEISFGVAKPAPKVAPVVEPKPESLKVTKPDAKKR